MLRGFPLKWFVRYAARRYGIIDPATVLARIRKFAQPSEVNEPLELVRGWVIFHARGIVNTRAIQHNLDWQWPYWIVRQFDPKSTSFVPRAYSVSHINMTHRNWTAVGLPDTGLFPLVDPRGMVTPKHDGWSLDFWLMDEAGQAFIPARLEDEDVRQRMEIKSDNCIVHTAACHEPFSLDTSVHMTRENGTPTLRIDAEGYSRNKGFLVAAVRPYNSEGIQFIDTIEKYKEGEGWIVNGDTTVKFARKPSLYAASQYHEGDVFQDLPGSPQASEIKCPVGMATGAALFDLEPGRKSKASFQIPLGEEAREMHAATATGDGQTWKDLLAHASRLKVPDERIQYVYDTAVRSMILLSADEICPGPAIYRRFWFRDACLMMHALAVMGLEERAWNALQTFPDRQRRDGYFLSQSGEWDSNGQVLWIASRLKELTAYPFNHELQQSMEKGARWLQKKRVRKDGEDNRHAGLLPAGFSAEHFGPNDYYYWDDFWAVKGLREISTVFADTGARELAGECQVWADDLEQCTWDSIRAIPERRRRGAIPASPYRRMDAGAIGVLVADYPLQLTPPGEERMMNTIEYLMEHCFQRGGFFQEMTHSGINAYLTLDIAQTLLRAGDSRWKDLWKRTAELASPTGQWPEAIHPATLGGCMGDGQHGWAAAEYVMMTRNAFVREEDDTLIVGSGIFPEWIKSGETISFGPTLTPWGPVSVTIETHGDSGPRLTIDANWRAETGHPKVLARIPGAAEQSVETFNQPITLEDKSYECGHVH